MPSFTIIIRVQDGFVQAVEGVPPGGVVRVLDFDCDDHTDGAGIPCLLTDYQHNPDGPVALTVAPASTDLPPVG